MGRIVPETSKSSSSSASSSLSVTETVNGWHDFKITGYSLSKGIGIGKYIASETFTVGGYSWAIYFYPDGKNLEGNARYVSLFIALVSEGTDVRALFELTLMDQSGNERHKVHTHFGRQLESGPFTLKYRGSMWGYKRFFERTTLETSDYLKDDCLQVRCCVGVVKSHTEGPKIYSIPEPMSDMGQHFGQLLESGKGTDVSFEVSGETFAAHKLVPAARSPVFRAQLFGPMKDQNTELIKVDEMEAPVFKESDPLLSNNKDVNDEKKAAQLKFDAGDSQPAPAVIGQATYGWTVNGLPAPRQGSVVGEPVNRAHWDSSLCACLGRNDDFCSSDLEVCILGSVAPCVLYGSNAERLGSSPGTFTNHCLPYSCLYMLSETLFGSNCLAPWFSYPTRSAIRRKFNLEGSCEALSRSCGCCGGLIEDEVQREQCESACDFATHTFCHPCALCQEGRELRRRLPHPGFNAQPVLVMIPPGEQSMGRNGA